MYAEGSPACKVFSNQYPGLCTTQEINQDFEAPCESDEFKTRYAILCDEAMFLQTYDIQGMYTLLWECEWQWQHWKIFLQLYWYMVHFFAATDVSNKSVWIIVIILLVLLMCLGVSGFIVYKLQQNGKITMPDFHFHDINFTSCRRWTNVF